MQLGKYERVTDDYVFFVRGPLSQWCVSEFICSNYIAYLLQYNSSIHKYKSCEQWMMHSKAILMNDSASAKLIMDTPINEVHDNKLIKDLGRKVSNFDATLWDKLKYSIVLEGNILKFSSNDTLRKYLDSTGDRTSVEAAWDDNVWGVGLRQTDDRILDPNQWQGENLLGTCVS